MSLLLINCFCFSKNFAYMFICLYFHWIQNSTLVGCFFFFFLLFCQHSQDTVVLFLLFLAYIIFIEKITVSLFLLNIICLFLQLLLDLIFFLAFILYITISYYIDVLRCCFIHINPCQNLQFNLYPFLVIFYKFLKHFSHYLFNPLPSLSESLRFSTCLI